MWWEVILDALKDTAILFPFLFLMYIVIEALEHNTGVSKPRRALTGKCAPLVGTALGIVPMCGFSVMAAKLYRHRYITVGTLLSVFIATSDEAFLVLLTTPVLPPLDKVVSILAMLGVKIAVGVAAGYLADLVANRFKNSVLEPIEQLEEHAGHVREERAEEHVHEEHEEREGHEEHEHFSACEHAHESKVQLYFVSPLLHALQVAAFVLLVNLAFGYLFWGMGKENVVNFLRAGKWIQPLVCSLVGFVPNCASSVVLAETYAVGGIEFGSCLAGLVTNAGLGVLTLFGGRKNSRNALVIMTVQFFIGVAVGYAVNASALLI